MICRSVQPLGSSFPIKALFRNRSLNKIFYSVTSNRVASVRYCPTPISSLRDDKEPEQPPRLTSYLAYALGGALVPIVIELALRLSGLHGGP